MQDVVKIQPVKAGFENFFLQFMSINTTIISILYINDNNEEKLHFLSQKMLCTQRASTPRTFYYCDVIADFANCTAVL